MESLFQIYKKVQSLHDKGDFNKLAACFRDIEGKGIELSPYFLILKSIAIQLADDSANYKLEDVEKSLLQALQIEPNNIDANIELGYFYYAVADQPSKATSFFENAEKHAEKYLLSAILGKAKVLIDLNKHDEAKKFLSNHYLVTHPEVKSFLDNP